MIAYTDKLNRVFLQDKLYDYTGEYIEVLDKYLPNPMWFDAFEIKNKKIVVNLEKAKKIKIEQLNLKKQRVLNSFYKPIEDARDEAMLDPSDINKAELNLLIQNKRKVRDLEFDLSKIKTIKGLENYMPKEFKD